MADRNGGLSGLAEGLRKAGASEAEIRWLLDGNDPEPWRAFAMGMVEAKGLLDAIKAGLPLPTHPGKGRA